MTRLEIERMVLDHTNGTQNSFIKDEGINHFNPLVDDIEKLQTEAMRGMLKEILRNAELLAKNEKNKFRLYQFTISEELLKTLD